MGLLVLMMAALVATLVAGGGAVDVSVATVVYASVGTAIVWQRPRTTIGWVLIGFALLWSATFFGAEMVQTASSTTAILAGAWLSEWTWFPALVTVFVVLPILFPTGSPLNSRWRMGLWLVVTVCVGFVVLTSIQGRFSPAEGVVVANPWALLEIDDVEVLLVPVAMPILALGPIAAVARYRRSGGVVREQIRWFMYAAVACGAMFALNALVDVYAPEGALGVVEAVLFVALCLPPIGIYVAISRHHLYDIDRLISRTLSYVLLSALLAGLYVMSVFLLGAILPFEGDLPIAGSTLLVAAVFNPLRRRVQGGVDRRFNRSRVDAVALVEAFSQRLRALSHLEGIGTELERAVSSTMQPSSLSLWVRPAEFGVPGLAGLVPPPAQPVSGVDDASS